MSEEELGAKLADRCEDAHGEKMAMVILFGITYAKEILTCAETTSLGAAIKEIRRHSKLPGKESSYQPEIRNGVTRARYVEPRTQPKKSLN